MLSQVEEIKEKLDIVKLISEYIKLKKVGANYTASCPFHSEKNPSFYVSPSRQIFKCFGCQKSGDVFQFIMEIEGLEFKEALQILAEKAGVELKKEPIQKRTEKQRQYEICELSAKFFEKQLEGTKAGKEIKKYLIDRGISEESIEKWRVGYSPKIWQALSDFLVSKNYKREEVIKAGLAIQSQSSSSNTYDRFRGRIIFPIFDLQDNVIGFGGRITESQKEKDVAKYVNTPNTLIYNKSWVLYGLSKAKTEIRKKDSAVLVEGYTDVILSSQSGVENVVSTSGTALTPYQLKILSRYTKNLLLAFDMDIAGEAATRKGIDIAQFQDFDIKVVSLPEGKDPADVARESSSKWKKTIQEAKEILDFYFQKSFVQFNKETIDGRRKISEILLPFIVRIQSRIEQAHWIKKISRKLDIKEEAIWEEILHKQNAGKFDIIDNALRDKERINKEIKIQQRQIEERLLVLLLGFSKDKKSDKKISGYIEQTLKLPKISFSEGEEILKIIQAKKQLSKNLVDFISEIELQFEIEGKEGDIEPEKEIQFCVSSLLKISKEKKLKKITQQLKESEKLKDKKEISSLLKKLTKL